MAATQGVLNHPLTADAALTAAGRSSMASSSTDSGTGSSTTASAGISANDFLTLLVTELKNQDPTANTDPNQYINQLVSVNSLEQLIDINQTLSTGLGGAATKPKAGLTSVPQASSPSGLSGQSNSSQIQPAGSPLSGLSSSTAPSAASARTSGQTTTARVAAGNLSVPSASSAANSVAHALDGRSQAESRAGGVLGVR